MKRTQRVSKWSMGLAAMCLAAVLAAGCAPQAGQGEGDAGGGDVAATPALSGTLEKGVRVVPVTARAYAYEPDRIVVQAGETVQLMLTSEDERHALRIEAYGIEARFSPGEPTPLTFVAEEPGEYAFFNTLAGGAEGEAMRGTLVILGGGSAGE